MTADVYVISMVGSSRRSRMVEQLDPLALSWRFFDAHTRLPEGLSYDPIQARRRHGRVLERGELGCFASHYALWQIAADLPPERTLLVLEDDLLLDPVFFGNFRKVADAALSYNYLRLYAKVPASIRYDGSYLDRHIARFHGRAYGTQAYFINAVAARRLLKNVRTVVRPVDDELDRFWAHGLPILCVFPFPVMEIQWGSTIETQRRVAAPLSVGDKVLSTATRAVEKLRRHVTSVRMTLQTQCSAFSFVQQKKRT